MPNIASLKMQNPLAIPTFLAFSTQKTPTRFHEDRKIYPTGYQAQKGAEPMKPSPDFWTTFVPTKKERL